MDDGFCVRCRTNLADINCCVCSACHDELRRSEDVWRVVYWLATDDGPCSRTYPKCIGMLWFGDA